MNKKFLFINLLTVLLTFGVMTNALAYTYEYTDNGTYSPSFGGQNPITYTLQLTPTDTTTYDFTFTIMSEPESGFSTLSDWYGGWFAFNLCSNCTASIDSITSYPAGTGPWEIGSISDEVLWGGGNFQSYLPGGAMNEDNWVGFHLSSLESSTDIPTTGVLLTADDPGLTSVFMGTILADDLFLNGIPFKAGLYDGFTGAGNVQFNQLSETVTPEPATMLLLGSGLIGLAGFRRKFRKR